MIDPNDEIENTRGCLLEKTLPIWVRHRLHRIDFTSQAQKSSRRPVSLGLSPSCPPNLPLPRTLENVPEAEHAEGTSSLVQAFAFPTMDGVSESSTLILSNLHLSASLFLRRQHRITIPSLRPGPLMESPSVCRNPWCHSWRIHRSRYCFGRSLHRVVHLLEFRRRYRTTYRGAVCPLVHVSRLHRRRGHLVSLPRCLCAYPRNRGY